MTTTERVLTEAATAEVAKAVLANRDRHAAEVSAKLEAALERLQEERRAVDAQLETWEASADKALRAREDAERARAAAVERAELAERRLQRAEDRLNEAHTELTKREHRIKELGHSLELAGDEIRGLRRDKATLEGQLRALVERGQEQELLLARERAEAESARERSHALVGEIRRLLDGWAGTAAQAGGGAPPRVEAPPPAVQLPLVQLPVLQTPLPQAPLFPLGSEAAAPPKEADGLAQVEPRSLALLPGKRSLIVPYNQGTDALQLRNFWLPQADAPTALYNCLEWVLRKGGGERRREVGPEWTIESLLEDGDQATALCGVRVRSSDDRRRWFVYFVHAERPGSKTRWQTGIEMYEVEQGAVLRLIASRYLPGRSLPGKLPYFVELLGRQASQCLRPDSTYDAARVHDLRGAAVEPWQSAELEHADRTYPLVLVGPRAMFPWEFFNLRGGLLGGALYFRLDEDAAARLRLVLSARGPGHHHLLDQVCVLGTDGHPTYWDSAQLRAIPDSRGLERRLVQHLQESDSRWNELLRSEW